ncbi:MAG: RNA polymerase sigma factor [Candidatus Paceibacterota bacterium]|jgi:RNA polymerase sigma-70 factor (ECF subfamily)
MSKKQEKMQQIITTAHHDYEKGLNSRAFFKTNNHSTGEDLVQETFMKTWKYLVKGGKIDTMKSFLYHILNNLIVDEYRKRKHQTTSLEILAENGFEPSTDDSERFLNVFDGKKAIQLILQLPLKYQKVMRMRYVQDLSLKEMSILTGQSKNAIAVQLHRGLERLKLLYKGAQENICANDGGCCHELLSLLTWKCQKTCREGRTLPRLNFRRHSSLSGHRLATSPADSV